jgi:ribosome-binding protein aMBF1 (putative translation factor)
MPTLRKWIVCVNHFVLMLTNLVGSCMVADMDDIFPDRLRSEMSRRGVTCVQLARSLRVHTNTISNWRWGKAEPSTRQVWLALAWQLDCEVGWLMGEDQYEGVW